METGRPAASVRRRSPMLNNLSRNRNGIMVLTVMVVVLGFFLLYPVIIILINSFNTGVEFFGDRSWGLDNWRSALQRPGILESIWNSFMIWMLVTAISFPIATVIAWVLARTNIPFSRHLEFLFWISFMLPGLSTTIGWIMLLDPQIGMLNYALREYIPFITTSPFNIYSVPGIVWAHVMANGIAVKVMLLTPAFRNMDSALEEASRVSGATTFRTMMRVTLPLMVPSMGLVLALQLIRILQAFEIELILGSRINFYVFGTMIYRLIRREPPLYGEATALAGLSLLLIALIIPLQRWLLHRRLYTTVSGQFRPGLHDLGRRRYLIFGIIALTVGMLTIAPVAFLIVGSFMARVGHFYYDPLLTFEHWTFVFSDQLFLRALRTTLIVATTAAVLSPLLFSTIAYVLVRTRWPGRFLLDWIIWGSAPLPGILVGFGLLQIFLFTPGLSIVYGTIWALLIVVVLQGNTTGTNIAKTTFIQVGSDMEEAARVAGAGWFRTYFRIWVPLMMPTLVMLAMMNFVLAAGATSQVILLASRDTLTLSLLALEYTAEGVARWEEAGIISLVIIFITIVGTFTARQFGSKVGVRHEYGERRREAPAAVQA